MPQVLLDDILKDVGVGSLLDENPTFTIEADAAVAHNIGLVHGPSTANPSLLILADDVELDFSAAADELFRFTNNAVSSVLRNKVIANDWVGVAVVDACGVSPDGIIYDLRTVAHTHLNPQVLAVFDNAVLD